MEKEVVALEEDLVVDDVLYACIVKKMGQKNCYSLHGFLEQTINISKSVVVIKNI